jgi:hypothetical protein
MNINLHNIFRYLVKNDEFLLTVHEVRKIKKEKEKPAIGIIEAITGPTLNLGERQALSEMPDMFCSVISKKINSKSKKKYIEERSEIRVSIKDFLGNGHERLGVQSTWDKNFTTESCSFICSLHIIFRPEIYSAVPIEQSKDHELFENFLFNMMERNYRIDKTKNTRKAKAINLGMINEIRQDTPQHETIRTVINIFEINLVLFDTLNNQIMLYWTGGTKYPQFNFCKPLAYMIRTGNHYEPIIDLRKKDPYQSFGKGYLRRLYKQLFDNIHLVTPYPPIVYGIEGLMYPSQWRDKLVFETALPQVFLPDLPVL